MLFFIPEISAGINFTLSDEEFPPKNKGWSLKFDFKLPLAYVPINASTGFGTSDNNNSRNVSSSNSSNILQNITFENDLAQARLKIFEEQMKYDELKNSIDNDVARGIENYIETLKIYNLKIEQNDFAKQKLEIMRLQLNLGEVKRIDLLKEEIAYNQSLIDEKNNVIPDNQF